MSKQEIIQRIAMKAVIVHEGKILILREADTYEEGTNIGRYHMPGGRINPGEHFEDGLKREVMEETGLDIEIVMPLYVGEWSPVIKGVPNQIIAMFMVCQPKDATAEIVLSEEHDAFAWIDPLDGGSYDVMDPEDKVIGRFAELSAMGIFGGV